MGELEPAIEAIKIFTLGTLSFLIAFFTAPFLIKFLNKNKLWRNEKREKSIDGKKIPIFKRFHGEEETKIPRFGGLLIWLTVLILILFFFFLSKITNIWWLEKLNFLSRGQTWLLLFTFIAASLLGLIDDLIQTLGKGKYIAGGLKLSTRLGVMLLIGIIGGLWFYFKLNWHSFHIPGYGPITIGWWYIPLFVLTMMATYSGGVIDGLDGLSGGALTAMFGSFIAIALFRNQIDIAAFCAAIVGSLLAFLWYNIPPAKFYMGETGIMGLCATLTVVTFLTDSVLVLPIIGFLLVLESASVIIQLISKKFF
ncbi:MAG: glycosyltransferase family 4 protein, partial [Minisyncoccales bacterium]